MNIKARILYYKIKYFFQTLKTIFFIGKMYFNLDNDQRNAFAKATADILVKS